MFVRLKGRNGERREFNALIDTGSKYCIIPKVDAYALGYPEAVEDDPRLNPTNALTVATHGGFCNGALLQIEPVDVGTMTFRGIDFIAFDIPQVTRLDVVLGWSLLRHMKLEVDYPSARLRMEKQD